MTAVNLFEIIFDQRSGAAKVQGPHSVSAKGKRGRSVKIKIGHFSAFTMDSKADKYR